MVVKIANLDFIPSLKPSIVISTIAVYILKTNDLHYIFRSAYSHRLLHRRKYRRGGAI